VHGSNQPNFSTALTLEEEGEEQGIWINADPLPGCVVCNIGEMWETWTNGLYKATLHRVVHRGSNYRVSIPFFFEPNFNARVGPLTAALRLQENTIQSAYHTNHSPRTSRPSSGSSDGLSRRVANLISQRTPSSSSFDNEPESKGKPKNGKESRISNPVSVEKAYEPVVYGEFLLGKVGNNFASGKGKYD